MKNFDEYIYFVVGAKIAGCKIQAFVDSKWFNVSRIEWNWDDFNYRIKLPKGYEYVIEDGEIAFREPKEGENYLSKRYNCKVAIYDWTNDKRPIIRKTK